LQNEPAIYNSAAAPVAERVVQKSRRHSRNQSMIGALASTTFEVSEKSSLTQSQVEEQILNALSIDSQGQKITFVE